MIAESPEYIIKARGKAAKALGISDRQLGYWVNEPWFPESGKTAAGWNISVIREARDEQGRRGSNISDVARKIKLAHDSEKLKQARLITESKQLANAVKRGELIERGSLELFAATLLTELGDWITQLPDIIELEVPKKYREKLIARVRAEFDSKRRQTAASLARYARELDAERAVEPK